MRPVLVKTYVISNFNTTTMVIFTLKNSKFFEDVEFEVLFKKESCQSQEEFIRLLEKRLKHMGSGSEVRNLGVLRVGR